MIDALCSSQLPPPRFRYSPMVKAGPYYQSAGMIALDKDSGLLETGGVYQETKKILTNMKLALPDFGLVLQDMMSARIYTTQFNEFFEINRAWEEVFVDRQALPARTSVGVVMLPLGANVEIEFFFYKSDKL